MQSFDLKKIEYNIPTGITHVMMWIGGGLPSDRRVYNGTDKELTYQIKTNDNDNVYVDYVETLKGECKKMLDKKESCILVYDSKLITEEEAEQLKNIVSGISNCYLVDYEKFVKQVKKKPDIITNKEPIRFEVPGGQIAIQEFKKNKQSDFIEHINELITTIKTQNQSQNFYEQLKIHSIGNLVDCMRMLLLQHPQTLKQCAIKYNKDKTYKLDTNDFLLLYHDFDMIQKTDINNQQNTCSIEEFTVSNKDKKSLLVFLKPMKGKEYNSAGFDLENGLILAMSKNDRNEEIEDTYVSYMNDILSKPMYSIINSLKYHQRTIMNCENGWKEEGHRTWKVKPKRPIEFSNGKNINCEDQTDQQANKEESKTNDKKKEEKYVDKEIKKEDEIKEEKKEEIKEEIKKEDEIKEEIKKSEEKENEKKEENKKYNDHELLRSFRDKFNERELFLEKRKGKVKAPTEWDEELDKLNKEKIKDIPKKSHDMETIIEVSVNKEGTDVAQSQNEHRNNKYKDWFAKHSNSQSKHQTKKKDEVSKYDEELDKINRKKTSNGVDNEYAKWFSMHSDVVKNVDKMADLALELRNIIIKGNIKENEEKNKQFLSMCDELKKEIQTITDTIKHVKYDIFSNKMSIGEFNARNAKLTKNVKYHTEKLKECVSDLKKYHNKKIISCLEEISKNKLGIKKLEDKQSELQSVINKNTAILNYKKEILKKIKNIYKPNIINAKTGRLIDLFNIKTKKKCIVFKNSLYYPYKKMEYYRDYLKFPLGEDNKVLIDAVEVERRYDKEYKEKFNENTENKHKGKLVVKEPSETQVETTTVRNYIATKQKVPLYNKQTLNLLTNKDYFVRV